LNQNDEYYRRTIDLLEQSYLDADARGDLAGGSGSSGGLERWEKKTPSVIGLRKPHRYLFEAAARQMRLQTQNVWYLGDRIDTDIAGARAARMVAVWFERGGSPTLDVGGADAKVHSWGEFRSLVEATC